MSSDRLRRIYWQKLLKPSNPGAAMIDSSTHKTVFWIPANPLEPQLEQILRVIGASEYNFAEVQCLKYGQRETHATELLEKALNALSGRLAQNSPLPSFEKMRQNLRKELVRIVKKPANHRKYELAMGSILDVDKLCGYSERPDYEGGVFLNRFLSLLTPKSRMIANARLQGYTWREIGDGLGVAYSGARKSYQREADAALVKLGYRVCDKEKPFVGRLSAPRSFLD